MPAENKEQLFRRLREEYEVPYMITIPTVEIRTGIPASFCRRVVYDESVSAYFCGDRIYIQESKAKDIVALRKQYMEEKKNAKQQKNNCDDSSPNGQINKQSSGLAKHAKRLPAKTSKLFQDIVNGLKKGGMTDNEAVVLVSSLIQTIKQA